MQTHCKLVVYVQISQDILRYLVCFDHMESLKPFLRRMEPIPLAVGRMDPHLVLFGSASSHILVKMDPVFPAEPLSLSTPMTSRYVATYLVLLTPILPS